MAHVWQGNETVGRVRYGPRPLDEKTPNSARLYDYYLGGSHNLEVDRALASKIIESAPHIKHGARANRAFLQRAVRYLVTEAGIDQFLDLGSGVPTVGNVHEIAQRHNPSARVVYVDYEPIAFHTAKEMLTGNDNATILRADLRDVQAVVRHPETQRLLDFSRPIGLLLLGVLLFINDDDRPAELIASYRDELAAGSYLALSHTSVDEADPDIRAEVATMQAGYQHATEFFHVRDKAAIASWFAGTQLVAPGVVGYCDWRPDAPISAELRRVSNYGYVGVGRIE